MARPFVKWAGGKTQLLAELLAAAPAQIETYYEPFLGGGALFFALQAQGRFKRAVLSDSNEELINAYIHVRDHVEQLIHALRVHERKYRSREAEARAEYFYTIRGKRLTCDLGGAANLIFLNKTCFNGLYRVNSSGGFNVPHGRYANPMICDEQNLRAASEALSTVELRVGDFAEAAAEAGTGDFVYFDPPYVPLSTTANFTSYTSASVPSGGSATPRDDGGVAGAPGSGGGALQLRASRCGAVVRRSRLRAGDGQRDACDQLQRRTPRCGARVPHSIALSAAVQRQLRLSRTVVRQIKELHQPVGQLLKLNGPPLAADVGREALRKSASVKHHQTAERPRFHVFHRRRNLLFRRAGHALVFALDPQSRSKFRAPQHYVNVSLPPPHSSSDPHLRPNLKPQCPSEIGNRVL